MQGTNLTDMLRKTYYTTETRPSQYYLDDVELMAGVTIRL